MLWCLHDTLVHINNLTRDWMCSTTSPLVSISVGCCCCSCRRKSWQCMFQPGEERRRRRKGGGEEKQMRRAANGQILYQPSLAPHMVHNTEQWKVKFPVSAGWRTCYIIPLLYFSSHGHSHWSVSWKHRPAKLTGATLSISHQTHSQPWPVTCLTYRDVM